MEIKDWLIPVLTGFIGLGGALGGAAISGHYQELSGTRQSEVELKKLTLTAATSSTKELREVAAKYISASDALIFAIVFTPTKEKIISDKLMLAQAAGAEIIVLSDDELAKFTNSVNYYMAALAVERNPKSVQEGLNKLATIRAQWTKQLRVSMADLNNQKKNNLMPAQ